jgi:hypothetical protein
MQIDAASILAIAGYGNAQNVASLATGLEILKANPA